MYKVNPDVIATVVVPPRFINSKSIRNVLNGA